MRLAHAVGSHWPDCNWCSKGSTHFVSPNSTDPDSGDSDDTDDSDGSGYPDNPGYPADSDGNSTDVSDTEDLRAETVNVNFFVHNTDPFRPRVDVAFGSHRRMRRVYRPSMHGSSPNAPRSNHVRRQFPMPNQPATALPIPTALPTAMPQGPTAAPLPLSSSTTSNRVVGTQAPAEAPAKAKPKNASCTPSPTKSLAPSASEYR